MRAVRLTQDGLNLDEVEIPRPSENEVLVRVSAAAITRDELTWPIDRLPATPSYELSGVVVAVAPDVEDVGTGEEVFALTPFDRDGVASDYAVVPAAVLAPKPRTLTHRESAALTLAGLAAWQGLFEHGALRDGERVRVLGAHGGVGHLAVQLAGDALAGPDERADLVFDTVGGDALAAAVGSAPRVVSRAEEVEGVTYFIVEPSRGQLIELARRADAGELKPAIDSVFPLEEARAAFARLSERGKSGKVVLVPSSSSGGRTDRASRVIAAAPERVFPALVDPEALTAWLPPDGMRGRFERFDARPGGPYRLVLTYADASAAPGKSTADS